MAGFIPDSIIPMYTGAAFSGFLSFRRGFVVHKEPIQTVSNINSDNTLVGYGSTSNSAQVTYTPVSATFSGVVLQGGEREFEANTFTKANSLYDGTTRLKVMNDARTYIESGKTESIEFDDTVWNINGPYKVSNYLGLKFYYYPLVQVK